MPIYRPGCLCRSEATQFRRLLHTSIFHRLPWNTFSWSANRFLLPSRCFLRRRKPLSFNTLVQFVFPKACFQKTPEILSSYIRIFTSFGGLSRADPTREQMQRETLSSEDHQRFFTSGSLGFVYRDD